MKRLTSFLLSLLLLVTPLLFTACGTEETDSLASLLEKPEDYVSLPDFSEIRVAKADVEKDVNDYLDRLLADMTDEYFDLVEGPAQKGDKVNIFYEGRAKDPSVTLSEDSIAGMSNKNDAAGFDLVLGSERFIPGFEDQLIGAKAGDHVAVDLSFPVDQGYEGSELAGLPVIFEVDVVSVKRLSVTEDAGVALSYTYQLPEGETLTEKMEEFIEAKTDYYFLSDTALPFDTYWTVADIKDALLGAPKYGEVSIPLTLSAESAAELGYDHALELTLLVTVESSVTTPKALTDELVKENSGGAYQTLSELRAYLTGRFEMDYAYTALTEAATYQEMPEKNKKALVNDYYTYYLESSAGVSTDMTDEERENALAAYEETLSDEERTTMQTKAEEAAEEEYRGRILFAYLGQRLNVTLTEEEYQTELQKYFEEMFAQNYYYMVMAGITNAASLEAYYGKDYFWDQFLYDKIITEAATKVTFE